MEAAPSHGCSLDSPWGGSPGTATGNQHCPWEALGSPALCWPQIPLSYLVVGLLSGAACAHVPASLNTDTRLGSPCSGSAGLLWEELLSSRADAEIRNCSLFSWTFSPLGLAGRGPSPGLLWGQGMAWSRGCSVPALKDESLLLRDSTLSGLGTLMGFISCSAGFGLWKLVQDGPRKKRDRVDLPPCTMMHFAVGEAAKLPALNVYLYLK